MNLSHVGSGTIAKIESQPAVWHHPRAMCGTGFKSLE